MSPNIPANVFRRLVIVSSCSGCASTPKSRMAASTAPGEAGPVGRFVGGACCGGGGPLLGALEIENNMLYKALNTNTCNKSITFSVFWLQ